MQDFLKKINLRELRLLLAGVGAVAVAISFSALALPEIKSYRVAARNVEVLRSASQDGAKLENQLQDLHAAIEDLKYRLHGDMANLPVREVEAYIVGRLQRISWNNNVELVSVEPAAGERVQVFQEILFNVQLVGEYEDLYHWLWEARNELGFVVVKEYGLVRRDQVDDNPRLLADLSLASYRSEL